MDLNNLFAGVTLTLPGWALASAGVVVFLLLILILRSRADRGGLATLAQLSLVAVIAGAAYFGLKLYEDNSRLSERIALEERASVLLAQSGQPDSVLGCLNVSLAPALDDACEKAVFAEPQRITSAISVIADRLTLMEDIDAFAAREPAFAQRFEPLRRSLESDPYGIVSHVLSAQFKCLPDSCPRLRIFKDADKIKANLSNRAFDRLLLKHRESWAKNPASDQFGEVSDILTLGMRPDNNEALNWGEQEASQTPPEPFVPQATTGTQPSQQVRPGEAGKNAKQQKAAPAKQKQQPVAGEQKKQQQPPTAAQARKKGGPPEPVGGLPRVTSRHGLSEPDDEDDTPAPSPPQEQQKRSPFGIFGR